MVVATLAVDLDHTLVDEDKPKQFAKEAINILREKGHKVIIHTCNNPQWAERVLNNNDIRFDYIWSDKDGRKPVADLYVDDRGYHFRGDWETEVNEILLRIEGQNNHL